MKSKFMDTDVQKGLQSSICLVKEVPLLFIYVKDLKESYLLLNNFQNEFQKHGKMRLKCRQKLWKPFHMTEITKDVIILHYCSKRSKMITIFGFVTHLKAKVWTHNYFRLKENFIKENESIQYCINQPIKFWNEINNF